MPVSVHGREMIAFVDPLRIAEEGFAVDRRALPILAMMDGSNDLRAIQMGLVRLSGGSIVSLDEVMSLVERLDEAFLLDSERFRLERQSLVDAFARTKAREPYLAGRSYEADPEALKDFIASIEAGLSPLEGRDPDGICGVVAPHIDVAVAASAYVDVYRRLEGGSFDTVVVLGVNHQGSRGLYSLTEKDFVTPFGVVETRRDLVRLLASGLPENTLAPDDFDHKAEHSIEFQLVFLGRYLRTGFRIVPVLCGSFHEFVGMQVDPFSDARFTAFRDNMARVLGGEAGRVLVVAGVDFSHVGRKFGHDRGAAELVNRARAHDRDILECLGNRDAAGILRLSRQARDWSHVCGLPALVLFATILSVPTKAELLCHETYDEPATQSAVTYAAMVFHRS